MKILSAIIVDDESLARRGLAVRLQHLPQVDVVAQCQNGEEALAAIAQHSPDLVFLDIQMPGMGGFDVIARLQADSMPMVIFVTAFDEYAVEAFRVHAVDYVLKPIDDDRLHEAVERALAQHDREQSSQSKEKLVKLVMNITGESASGVEHMLEDDELPTAWPEKITLKEGTDIRFIRVTDIQWVDAAGDYMCIHANGETHIMRITMKQLEKLLNPAVFLRVHRSTMVNTGCIEGAQTLNNGEFLLNLSGGAQLKASRSYRDRITQFLTS